MGGLQQQTSAWIEAGPAVGWGGRDEWRWL